MAEVKQVISQSDGQASRERQLTSREQSHAMSLIKYSHRSLHSCRRRRIYLELFPRRMRSQHISAFKVPRIEIACFSIYELRSHG